MKLNPRKTKSMVVSRSRTIASGYGNLTFGGEELKVVKRIFDSKLTFKAHLLKVMSIAVRTLAVVSRAGKLFDCPCVLKSCFNAYVCPT